MATFIGNTTCKIPQNSVNYPAALVTCSPSTSSSGFIEVWAQTGSDGQALTMDLVNVSTGQRAAGPSQTFSSMLSYMRLSAVDVSVLNQGGTFVLRCTSQSDGAIVGALRMNL